MTQYQFDNWSASLEMPTRRTHRGDGVDVAEHTGAVERAVFASVWNTAAKRAGISGQLRRPLPAPTDWTVIERANGDFEVLS